MNSKRMICVRILLMMFSLLLLAPTSHAQESQLDEAIVMIDNQPFTTKYIMREGHLLVPALFFKHTGTFVDWNEEYSSVVFRVRDIQFALPIGKNFTDDLVKGNWQRGTLPTKTIDYQGQVFVPLVQVARKLEMDVRYDPTLRRTFITSNIEVKPNRVDHGDQTKKLVALTFDDGPDDQYTPKILAILKEKGARATFFVVGNQIEEFSEQMKRIVQEGHGIANHTWSHPDLRKIWSADVKKEIQSTQAEMIRVVGRQPDLFRPPYGAYTKSDLATFNELGMRNILWNVDTMDWSGLSGDEIVKNVKRDISPGGIILQHNFPIDSDLLAGTVDALPKIIDELRAEGYQFVTVQTLLSARGQ